jgi:hypothetical protein
MEPLKREFWAGIRKAIQDEILFEDPLILLDT